MYQKNQCDIRKNVNISKTTNGLKKEKSSINEESLLKFLKPTFFDMIIGFTKDLGGFS